MADIAILGLSITSSWGNGHATTYRALVKALARRGHRVLFLERDVPWYAETRDLMASPWCRVALYRDFADLDMHFADCIAGADAVIVGSYVPDGIVIGEWAIAHAQGPVAFYDIDTPITLRALETETCSYLSPELAAVYDLYLSFTGGPALARLRDLGARHPVAFYCSVDPEVHAPVAAERRWALGYIGTYSPDRQSALDELLIAPAAMRPNKAFVVAGAQYPDDLAWPENIQRTEHLPPNDHSTFYCAQGFTLNITRADMRTLGYSPSVRMFEAAACGVPLITDAWPGLEDFFVTGEEILLAESTHDVLRILDETPIEARRAMIAAARRRVLRNHTAAHRAQQLETLLNARARDKTDFSISRMSA